ncbi:flagellar hook-length control protein FliK [Paenibacillus rhizovicinus]|uniref:Flagellar hook-length control protein FliK n=1 Tax=Paenibacillus rhizovicinus TaxID=2704463 RepID=A0A6C0NV74_9BACL|nr:flagellar hook-length control protein FliK [Paenibacillus rhizovicinus]QHW30085.1 flagellar hook-length control protein FliK [Paenibacillus rhizovicinus]
MMSMSIGQLIKGLVGDAQPSEGKAIELKVGQTVRGVLVKMTGVEEGIIQINGTPVHAKLETPLEPGQAMLLQVQPESGDGTLVLKQADPKSAVVAEAGVKEWMKALGLPDTKASADLVGELRKDGVVLTRELASQFKAALAAMPAGGDAQSWAKAAALAVRRGLPMTGATIGALQQVLAGPPAHELLDALEAGLAAWRGEAASGAGEQAPGGATQPPRAAQAAAAKLQALLSEGAALMRVGGDGGSAELAPFGAAGARGTASAEPVPRGAAGAAAAPAARGAAAPLAAGAGAAGMSAPAGAQQANGVLQGAGMQQTIGADHAAQEAELNGVSRTSTGSAQQTQGQAALRGGMQPLNGNGHDVAVPLQSNPSIVHARVNQTAATMLPHGGQQGGNVDQANSLRTLVASTGSAQPEGLQASEANTQDNAGGSWVKQVMKWMGVDHERLLATATIKDSADQASTTASAPNNASPPAATHVREAAEQRPGNHSDLKTANDHAQVLGSQARSLSMLMERNQQQSVEMPSIGLTQDDLSGDDGVMNTSESLKSALMTIAASDDVPQQLRDTAQQLVSHITGQQLLLSPEKNGALFSHVTMFIPMKGQDGSQTASVHIQTRRGRKGELDGDNCRLVFDLRMKNLGDTVVDVQVINKIVNLHVWNDHPATAQLVESARNELNTAMANAGYQLLTLRVDDMPERIVDRLNGHDGLQFTAEGQDWSTKPYKGVDLRV